MRAELCKKSDNFVKNLGDIMDTVNLPTVIEMEKEVLGAMILKDGLVIPKVMAIVKEEDFYLPEHRLFYRTIVGQYEKGIKPNILSLVEELRKMPEWKIMDPTYVMVLANVTYTTAYAELHAKKIKEKAILRRMIEVGERMRTDASLDIKPLEEILKEAEQMMSEVKKETTLPNFSCFSKYFTEKFKKNIDMMSAYGNRKTGYENVDREQIFSPGLYVLGGLPALGKTTFAWQMLEQLARAGEKCIYCSYEMSEFELFTKSVSREVYRRESENYTREIIRPLTSAAIRRGELGEEHLENFYSVEAEFCESRIDLSVMEMEEHDIDDLIFKLRMYCEEKAPVIVLDYLQIIPVKSKETNAKAAIDETVRKLKNFQRETGATFIVISSFNRQNYTQQVAFESFKESGNIEYSADVVWGLQLYFDDKTSRENRENVEKAKNETPRRVELKCLKNRQGRNYSCYYKYYPAVDAFQPCSREEFQEKTSSGKRWVK